MKQEYPILYKRTSTGAIQFWEIKVEEVADGSKTNPEISTRYGQLGTDSPQYTFDMIREGKNKGRKNETSPWQQAVSEAKAKWEKQKKKGYVESIQAAEAGELDDLIEGGISPMLAHKFTEHAKKVKYPAFVQPKLDGIRCIAIVKNGECTLWSRTRKPITSCPHIVQELEALFSTQDIILDGELYNHEFKTNFEHIVHLVRQQEPDPQHTDVQYHVYDLVSDETFETRIQRLQNLFEVHEFYSLYLVETLEIELEDDVMKFFDLFKEKGYEGAMLRNRRGIYVNKRSYDLQKVKEFDDGEFDIIGIDEGRGKLSGHVGAFRCRTPEGREFLAKMSGSTERLRSYFTNHSLWQGKRLTVQYQGITGKEGVPRFPVGIEIRDYE